MDYLWLILTLSAGFTSIAYNSITRVALKDNGRGAEFSWFLTVARTLLFFPAILEISKINWTPYYVWSAAGLAAVTFLNLYQFMKMHTVTELSVSTVIVHLKIVWVPLMAFMLLGEQLVYNSYLGIFMIFVATLSVSPPRSFLSDKASKQALLFSLSFSLMAVLQKVVSSFATFQLIIFLMSFPTALILPFIVKDFKQVVLRNIYKDLQMKVAIIAASVASTFLFILAINRGGTVSDTNAIYQGMSVLGVAFGVIFLKEKQRAWAKILAGIFVLAGIVLMTR